MTINDYKFAGKKAIVRVDFNVPLDENGHITDDTRIRGALPTLKKIIADGGACIIMSHMGKPKGKVNPKLSLGQIREAVEVALGAPVAFAPDCANADEAVKALPMGQALLLENLRFYPEEEGKPVGIDKADPAYDAAKKEMKARQKDFAKKLASYADCYVMDAFGTAHRKHASTAVIADYFDADNKMLGYLMEKEVKAVDNVLSDIKRPFVAIMGGSKVSSKIGIIQNLLGKVDKLIPLQKYDSYATAKNALENGNGVAWANDNTEVIAFANQNPGYTVGIASLGSQDTIAPAVSQGNTTVLDWLNEEIQKLGEENFFHKDYEATLVDTYGIDYEDELVVEGGVVGGSDDAASSEAASSEAASVAEGEGYTGTQTASAKGMNGDVTVTITFENGVATACDVDASTETESLGQAAAPTVADAIVAGNTPNVDAVSGSTVTSNAIMEAAKACYDAAGIAY